MNTLLDTIRSCNPHLPIEEIEDWIPKLTKITHKVYLPSLGRHETYTLESMQTLRQPRFTAEGQLIASEAMLQAGLLTQPNVPSCKITNHLI